MYMTNFIFFSIKKITFLNLHEKMSIYYHQRILFLKYTCKRHIFLFVKIDLELCGQFRNLKNFACIIQKKP